MSTTAPLYSAARRLGPVGRAVLVAVVCYAVLAAMPLVRGVPPMIGLAAGTVVFALFCFAVVASTASLRMSAGAEAAGLGALAACWYATLRLARGGQVQAAFLEPAASVLFVLACAMAGCLVGRIIRDRNLLLPVCVIAAIADVYTVFWGPTRKALEVAPQVVERLSVAVPKVGSASGPAGLGGISAVAMMGLGDFIFSALFVSAAARFGLGVRRTFWGILIAALAGMLLVLLVPGFPQTPLLPFIVAGFLVVNWRQFHLSPQERRSLAVAGAVILVAAIVISVLARLRS